VTAARPARVVLAGVHGYGAVHLRNLAQLGDSIRLVAVADPKPPAPGTLPAGAQAFPDLETLLDAVPDVDVVFIATPIPTHIDLVECALRAGADVLLEKPPFATLADFDRILAAADEAGRAIQVGFQSLGSDAIRAFAEDAFDLGELGAIGATGLWQRRQSYWSRAPWAGRRELNGKPVVDGVVTNPLSHSVVTALRIADARTRDDVLSVTTDLYRANDIEADDTSVVRIETAGGLMVTCALTLCAEEEQESFLTVRGSRGDATFYYLQDRVVSRGVERRLQRVGLLQNLIDHRATGAPLVAPLRDTGAFMTVLEAIRTADAPTRIQAEQRGTGADAHPVVAGIGEWTTRAIATQATFRELGAPWASPRSDAVIAELRLDDGAVVATLLDGAGTAPASSPRPYLQPVRTRAGIVVSDAHPEDHDWHLGVGVAMPLVGEGNFWGGPTYRSGLGYVALNDHGRIEQRELEHRPGGLLQSLDWRHRGSALLHETRELDWSAVGADAWQLELSFTLETMGDSAVALNSPGSNGREKAGYGGFFWRLPRCEAVDVRSSAARGEDAVHSQSAPWLAWSAEFDGGAATLAFRPMDAATSADPWFVRHEGYPAVGSSLAWASPTLIEPGAPLHRSFRILVADGRLSDAEVAAWAAR
jgi:predicted dehydrogenase